MYIAVACRKQKCFSWFSIVTVSTVAILVSLPMPVLYFLDGNNNYLTVNANLRILHGHLFKLVLKAQFVLTALVIQKRFKVINDFLSLLLVQKKLLNAYKVLKKNKFLRVYHKLCNAIDIVNDTATFNIVIIFAYTLVKF